MSILIAVPTKQYVLGNGWKADLVEYFTQGQYDKIQDAMLNRIEYDAGTQTPSGSVTPAQLRASNEVALQEAVKRLESPTGLVYEGENLTIETILSMPFDPNFPQGELVTLINAITNPKKKES